MLYFLAVKTGVTEREYYAFSAAYGRVMGAFTALAGIASTIAGIKPTLNVAMPILEAEPEISDQKEIVGELTGSIEINDVSFRYSKETPYVLEDLCLKVKPGEYLANDRMKAKYD